MEKSLNLKKEWLDILGSSIGAFIVFIFAYLFVDIESSILIAFFCQISSLSIVVKIKDKQFLNLMQKTCISLSVIILTIVVMYLSKQINDIYTYIIACLIVFIILLVRDWFRNKKIKFLK